MERQNVQRDSNLEKLKTVKLVKVLLLPPTWIEIAGYRDEV